MPSQIRSAGESAGRRFKRRRRKRGRRGAVSKRRGRDKSVEGKERQKRDRTERPGDRKELRRKKFERSRKRRPKRRRQRRQGGDRERFEKRDFDRGRTRFGDDERRGPEKQDLEDIRARINEIRARREAFSAQRPEQIAERRGVDPSRLQRVGLAGAPGQPQPQPTNLDQVNAYDAEPVYAQPQPAPAPAPQQPGMQIGPDGRVVGQPQPPAVAPAPEMGYTPLDYPGPTAPPGVATDAYGKPVQGPQPLPAQAPGFQAGGQMNPRAAGMDRFAQPPVRRPEEEYPVQ